ncbi:MAG: hypothetical protein WCT20_05330 [Candidatus Babeliales bacterium]|jgi:hypothetical protein
MKSFIQNYLALAILIPFLLTPALAMNIDDVFSDGNAEDKQVVADDFNNPYAVNEDKIPKAGAGEEEAVAVDEETNKHHAYESAKEALPSKDEHYDKEAGEEERETNKPVNATRLKLPQIQQMISNKSNNSEYNSQNLLPPSPTNTFLVSPSTSLSSAHRSNSSDLSPSPLASLRGKNLPSNSDRKVAAILGIDAKAVPIERVLSSLNRTQQAELAMFGASSQDSFDDPRAIKEQAEQQKKLPEPHKNNARNVYAVDVNTDNIPSLTKEESIGCFSCGSGRRKKR